jgi:hypothetical protein
MFVLNTMYSEPEILNNLAQSSGSNLLDKKFLVVHEYTYLDIIPKLQPLNG